MMQQEEIKVGDLLFLSQGIWLRHEMLGTFAKEIKEPCLGVVVESNIKGLKTKNSVKVFVNDHYKVCVGDEIFLLDEVDAHKYVRKNGD